MGRVNDFHVKLVKLQGEFIWHHHHHEDELFLANEDLLHMKMRDTNGAEHQELVRAEEFLIGRRGTAHRLAQAETHIMLLQAKATVNTSKVRNRQTVPHWQST